MSKKINPRELSLPELEARLETLRRAERARLFRASEPQQRFRPITVLPDAERADASAASVKSARARGLDRLLFSVEIAALAALLVILIAGLMNVETLKKDLAEFRGLPARRGGEASIAAVSALGGALVAHPAPAAPVKELPGSSFPPEDENFPPALGLYVKPVKSKLPPPVILPQMPTRIIIPALGVDWPVVDGDDWDALKLGVGHRSGTPNPGERGNMVMSGHNDVYGEVFKNLEYLGMNEEIIIYAGDRKFRYITRARRIVPPTDLSPLNPAREPIVTLITCWPYRVNTFRLIVVGELVQ